MYVSYHNLVVAAPLEESVCSGSSSSGALLRCLESLCLYKHGWEFPTDILNKLLVPLRLFPELKRLTFHSYGSRPLPSVESPLFKQAKACMSCSHLDIYSKGL